MNKQFFNYLKKVDEIDGIESDTVLIPYLRMIDIKTVVGKHLKLPKKLFGITNINQVNNHKYFSEFLDETFFEIENLKKRSNFILNKLLKPYVYRYSFNSLILNKNYWFNYNLYVNDKDFNDPESKSKPKQFEKFENFSFFDKHEYGFMAIYNAIYNHRWDHRYDYLYKINYLEMIKFLVEILKIDTNKKGYLGKTPLEYAISIEVDNDLIEYLKTKTEKIETNILNLNYELIEAIKNNNIEIVKYLISKGADVNTTKSLRYAIERNNSELINFLLSKAEVKHLEQKNDLEFVKKWCKNNGYTLVKLYENNRYTLVKW